MRILFTCIIIVLALGGMLLSNTPARAENPRTDAPIWLWSDCSIPSVTVAWFNPPEEVLPFTAYFPAYLTIIGDGFGEIEIMSYAGKSTCPLYPGCIYYRWRKAGYKRPEGDYTLSAYVVNAADEIFYVQPDNFDPGCNNKVYLPMILK